jgi:hypothetical protein
MYLHQKGKYFPSTTYILFLERRDRKFVNDVD